MPDNIQSYKVLSVGGLNATQNHLQLSEESPGVATRLVNYEPSLFGGYRRIDGFTNYGQNVEVGGDDAEGPILGLEIFFNENTSASEVIAARKDRVYKFTVTSAAQSNYTGADDNSRTLTITNPTNVVVRVNGNVQLSSAYNIVGNTVSFSTAPVQDDVVTIDNQQYSFYRGTTAGSWSKYTTGLIHNTATPTADREIKRIRAAKYNFGGGGKICLVDGINNAVVFNGITWTYLSPTNTGASGSPGGSNVPARPELVNAFEGYLFLGGDQVSQDAVAFSDTRNDLNFDPATNSSILRVGFDVVQLAPFRKDLFIFGRNQIKKAVEESDLIFILEPVTANMGCVARDSVVEIGGDLAFLAPDGVRPVAGTSRVGDVEIETISKAVQTLLSTLGDNYDLDDLVGVVVRTKSQLRYLVSGDESTVSEAFGIIGGLRTADQQLGWEFGEMLGMRANCATSDFINGSEVVLHGDYNGKVYQQERGTNFDGSDIVAVYSTPFFDFGDTEVRKHIRRINTFVRAEGPMTINLGLTYDWFAADTFNPANYVEEIEGRPVQYRGQNVTYAASGILYGGSDKPIISTAVEGSGFSVRATYVTIGDFDPYSIQGLVIEYTQSGRR